MKTLGIVAAAMLMTATGAAAEEPQAEEKPAKEKKICRTEKMTGSLTRVRRTCLTQREWDQLAAGTRRNVDRLTRDANQVEALRRGDANGAGAMAGGGAF